MPGRGRGGRGRGSGRGRGGRRGRGGQTRGAQTRGASQCASNETPQREYSLEEDPSAYFTGTASTSQHLTALQSDRIRYAATLAVLVKHKIQIAQNARVRALAMAWANGDKDLANELLKLRTQFGLVEVLRAVSMLDAGRQVRVLENRLKCLQLSGQKVSSKKMGKLKSDIDNLNKLKPPIGSASGAVCKQVAKWVRGFSAEELEFCAMHFPKDPWKKLADICHLNSNKDFPSSPWFLPYCFDTGSPPDGSFVHHCKNVTPENINQLVADFDIPYSILKNHKNHLQIPSKKRIAEYEKKLDTVLWYYEDIKCTEVDDVLDARLAAQHPITLPNGKLLERLLTIYLLRNNTIGNNGAGTDVDTGTETNFFTRLIDLAQPKLTSISLKLESPVVVIGDASSSMNVAIRTSTIIASLLTAICSAQLVFFNGENMDAPFLPETVSEMLKLAVTTQASGCTAPAASLYPFYARKEVVKTFIIVTDEEENTQCQGYRFAPLYKKYCEEVYPAYLVFVSFLRGQHARGQMVDELKNLGYEPKQLRLEGSRPDLTRLDDLFAQLSAQTTSSVLDDIKAAEGIVKDKGLSTLFDTIKADDGLQSSEE